MLRHLLLLCGKSAYMTAWGMAPDPAKLCIALRFLLR